MTVVSAIGDMELADDNPFCLVDIEVYIIAVFSGGIAGDDVTNWLGKVVLDWFGFSLLVVEFVPVKTHKFVTIDNSSATLGLFDVLPIEAATI